MVSILYPFEMTVQWFAMRGASAWQRIIGFLLVSSEKTSVWCHWQPRQPADKRAPRWEAWSPEGMVWSRIQSGLNSCKGWSPPAQGPGLGERTRCICMTRPSSMEVWALSSISLWLWWTGSSLPSQKPDGSRVFLRLWATKLSHLHEFMWPLPLVGRPS